jgi:hypothetical protein
MLRRLLDVLRHRPAPPDAGAPRSGDHAADRETARVGRLSAEDRAWETWETDNRAWEAASGQRNRDNWEAASLQGNRDTQDRAARDEAARPPGD